jgi:hypothetical protein
MFCTGIAVVMSGNYLSQQELFGSILAVEKFVEQRTAIAQEA